LTYESDAGAVGKAADTKIAALELAAAQQTGVITTLTGQLTAAQATIKAKDAEIADLKAQLGIVTPPPVVTPPATGLAKLKRAPVLTAPTTITVTDQQGKIKLAAGKDYIIKLPSDRAWKNNYGLWVEGGRNVAIIGGTVDVGPGYYAGGSGPGVRADGYVKRAAYFLGVTGNIHLEGVAFTSSSGDLSEGINYSSATATAVIQHCKHLVPLKGSQAANHADAVQGWNGPKFLYIDNFYAETGYQGMFLNPNDTGTGPVDNNWELNNVEIVGIAGAKYILWVTSPPAKVITNNVYTSGGLGNWDAANDWPNVKHGVKAPVKFAPTAGFGYVSPGYV
jgi:uncharacterized coiled-coil protein SlyX